MSGFEKRLRQAAGEYVGKTYAGGETSTGRESLDERAAALLARKKSAELPRGKEFGFMKKQRKWTAVIAAAAVVALLGAAVAAGPVIRNFLNTRTAQESVEQLTEVPEGWIGIYTVEDLDAVREDLSASYILMEDLAFSPEDFEEGGRFAGGWEPIGRVRQPFIGIFNGNGHVIRGLYVTNEKSFAVEETKNYVGLFGYCILTGKTDVASPEELTPEEAEANGYQLEKDIDWIEANGDLVKRDFYVRAHTAGYIKNLGIEDSRIVGIYDADCTGDTLFVGSVAGYSKYIINCYAKNVTVEASVTAQMQEQTGMSLVAGSYTDRTYYSLSVGGITGGCYVMDCCWSDANVTVRADDMDVPSWHIGGLTGMTVTCITSYFDGMVDAGTLPDDGMFYVIKNDVPQILTSTVFEEIRNRLDEIDENKANMYASFYVRKPFGLTGAWRPVVQDLISSDAEELDAVWICDPDLKPREYGALSSLIGEAFPDGGFETYCRDNSVKYGCYYVYDLREDPAPDFEGFDPAIWDVTPGALPTLRIFG